MLGLDLERAAASPDLPEAAGVLLRARENARLEKDFQTSDRLRDELASMGVVVTDTAEGQRWKVAPRKMGARQL